MIKFCNKCKKEKDLSQFYTNLRYKAGVDAECKGCRALRSAFWRKKNLKQSAEIARTHRTQTKQRLVNEFGGKCRICGFNKSIAALEFHHLDPAQKETQVMEGNPTFKRAFEEAKKCILVCSNCHRMIHHNNLEIPKETNV